MHNTIPRGSVLFAAICVLNLLLMVLCASAAQKVPINFNDFHTYTATSRYLQDIAAAYPEITELREIGKSNMGRPIHVLIVTQRKSGTTVDAQVSLRNPRPENVRNVTPMKPHQGKPGHWICGSTHGNEYTGTEVCLYIIDKLVSLYGTDEQVTRLVEAKTLYICPILNPDGHAASLEKGISQRQNSMLKDDDGDGKINEDGPDDINGDGIITQFRYKDPKGSFVIDDIDPRLMIRLEANDKTPKERYSVIVEDRDNDGDGKRGEDPEAGIDLNRNFPESWWTAEGFPGGTGDYPTSAPETRAVAEFFFTHPNIFMAQFYHTSGGFTYRPLGTAPHPQIPPKDVAIFDRIMGKKYLEILGEEVPPAWNEPGSLDKFREELRRTSKNKYAIDRGYEFPYAWKVSYDELNDRRYGYGMSMDWEYVQLGVYSLTTELWNPEKDLPGFPKLAEDADRAARQRALLKYQDEKYGGKLFIPWTKFKHPELGEGEIGGWNPKYLNNAWPGEPLAGVCDRHYRFEMFRAGLMPEVVISDVQAKVLYSAGSANEAAARNEGGQITIQKGKSIGKYRVVEVTARIQNRGSLATHTARGAELRGNRQDVVWLLGDRDRMQFLQGTPWQRLGVLEGTMRIPGYSTRTAESGAESGASQRTPGQPRQMLRGRSGGTGGPAQTRQTGASREVKWLIAVEGDAPLKILSSSQKGGTQVKEFRIE
jgi:hypothetical protein